LVDHVASLVLNAAPRNATTHRLLRHFASHWPKASTRSGGSLDANAYKEPLLAATLNRDPALTAKLVGLLDSFSQRHGATVEGFTVRPIRHIEILKLELGIWSALEGAGGKLYDADCRRITGHEARSLLKR
jgi:hypothetical protein